VKSATRQTLTTSYGPKLEAFKTTQRKPVNRSRIAALLWAVFITGLLLQAFAPRLAIRNRAFVMPPSVMHEGNNVHPDSIVERERIMQMASGVLTVGGALALAFWYRGPLAQAFTLQSSAQAGGAVKAPNPTT
jgi:hypothetical protein